LSCFLNISRYENKIELNDLVAIRIPPEYTKNQLRHVILPVIFLRKDERNLIVVSLFFIYVCFYKLDVPDLTTIQGVFHEKHW